ncbi:MAG: hypothetical protein EXR99_05590 [Gemmataceae bacterium]|nr:hypothetical protein [Gemmataceae bacterium]
MWNCETTKTRILESLYSLLEPREVEEFEAHCLACPSCQSLREASKGQKEMLAAAARIQFPNIRFTPPIETLPMASSPRQFSKLARRVFALAAMLILALGVGTFLQFRSLGNDHKTVKDFDLLIASAQDQVNRERSALNFLRSEGINKVREAQEEIRKKQLKVIVTGPATLQPGAHNHFQILTNDNQNRPVESRVDAYVEDKANPGIRFPVASKMASRGNLQLTLPPDLPLKPNSRPVLIVSAKRDSGASVEIKEGLSLATAVHVAHLATDKPMYLPGETVHFRGLVLDRFSLRPPEEAFSLVFVLTTPTQEQRVVGQGNGTVSRGAPTPALINGPDGKPIRGMGAGSLLIEPNAPGGEYTLAIRDQYNRFPEQTRKFIVNRYQKPRINKELDFNRRTYGPGDEVVANCKATSADAKPLANRPVLATLTVDGQAIGADGKPSPQPLRLQTDNNGRVAVRMKLPASINKGQASLAVNFDDGGNVETLSKPVPIVINKLDIEFFPEGGDLVAGLNNRVYFQARTPLGKAADMEGRLLVDGQPAGISLKTLTDDIEPGINQGMGNFSFTAKPDSQYEVEVTSPASIQGKFKLPQVKKSGTVLTIQDEVIRPGKTVRGEVQTTTKSRLLVGLYCRGRLLDSTTLEEGRKDFELKPVDPIGGICRITVFEEKVTDPNTRDLVPCAERLCYRVPLEALRLRMTADKTAYVPGQKTKVIIETLDEKSTLTPAVLLIGVVDRTVVTMADEKTARTMPTHFLLTTEVRKAQDLEFADVLLGDHPKAGQALDLLLGTQGWRRFAEQNPVKFRQLHKEEADNLLVTIGQVSAQPTDISMEPVETLLKKYDPLLSQAEEKVVKAKEAFSVLASPPAVETARARLAWWNDAFDDFSRLLPALAVIGILLIAVFFSIRAVINPKLGRLVLGTIAGLCGILILFTIPFMGDPRPFMGDPRVEGRPKTAVKSDMFKDQLMDQGGAQMEKGMAKEGDQARFAMVQAEAKRGMEPNEMVLPRAMKKEMKAVGGLPPGAARLNLPGGPRPLNEVNKNQGAGRGAGKPLDGIANRPAAVMADQMPELELFARNKAQNLFIQEQPREDARQMIGGKFAEQNAQQMRRIFNRGEGMADRERMDAAYHAPMVYRQYAHERTGGERPELRSDFTETLYWNPVFITQDGKGEFSFDLSDNVTSFVATAFGHTLDGRLGAAKISFDSRLPLVLQPKIPLELTSGDEAAIPLAITNNSADPRQTVIQIDRYDGLSLTKGNVSESVALKPGETQRRLYTFKPLDGEGEAVLSFKGKAEGFAADAIRETIRVSSAGFPIANAVSDTMEGVFASKVRLPDTWIPGTLSLKARVFPSVLADLQKGLEGMLREPNGCFEQTSTSNYPNLLILDYIRESNQQNPEAEKRALELLDKGYKKLVSFECTDTKANAKKGYEWFGGTSPAHEALTAYGLLQFRDMSRVMAVDDAMLKRTRDYLMNQRDGNGGFKRNSRALDSFGHAPDNITNAYIVWSITESGKDDDVAKEVAALKSQAQSSKDPYFLALVGNTLLTRNDREAGEELLRKIIKEQKEDGHLDAEKTSITGSGGRDLQIETTALAILGWLKANRAEFNLPSRKAIEWVGKQRGGHGAFGSTQSTILALKALIAFTKANKKTAEAGELKLFLNDKQMALVSFPAGATEAMELTLPEPGKNLKPGDNSIRLEVSGKNIFPATLAWSYHTLQPPSADNLPVKMTSALSLTEAKEGDPLQLKLHVENTQDKGQGMAVAILGLPAGLALPDDLRQLRDLIRSPEDGSRPALSAFETRGRELVLYWRDLAPMQKIDLNLDLICRVPGSYTGQASRAYLYYNADNKHWTTPLQIKIAPR